MDSIVLAPRRRTAIMDTQLESTSARDLVKQQWNSLKVEESFPGLRLQPRALVVVSGPPGAGKSTFALGLADCLARPVVFYSAEERLGAAVGERLSRLGIHRPDFHVVGRVPTVDDLTTFGRQHKAAVVVVDSVQATTFLPSDLRGLINYLSLDLLIGTSQVTKAGDMRGSRVLEHEADVVIDVEDGAWSITKTRFGRTGVTGEVVFNVTPAGQQPVSV